jgi:hypothetical protein
VIKPKSVKLEEKKKATDEASKPEEKAPVKKP